MKIKFIGFRGFDDNSGYVDLKDISILLGKNSSGKSTVIKLLLLFRDYFRRVNSISDLYQVQIDIANVSIGGKRNLLREGHEKPKLIFQTQFEFYLGYHECEITFASTNNSLTVECLEIKDGNGALICTTDNSMFYYDVFQSIKIYNHYVPVYNVLEMNHYKMTVYSIGDETADPTYFDNLLIEPTSKALIKEYSKHHLGLNHDHSVLFDIVNEENDFPHPFKGDKTPDKTGFYSTISTFEDSDLLFTKSNLLNVLNQNPKIKEEIEFYNNEIKKADKTYDVFNAIIKWTEFQFGRYPYSLKFGSQNNWTSFFIYQNEYFPENENIYYEPMNFDILRSANQKVLDKLFSTNSAIFEKGIVRSLRKLGSIDELNNVTFNKKVTYDKFNKKDIVSQYFAYWEELNPKKKKEQLDFMNKYLKLFGIGTEINFELLSNLGTVKVLKIGKKEIHLSENGTGISKLLQIILFLGSKLKDENDSDYRDNSETYVILQEPEVNLHPRFQSLLADLFVDFSNKYRIGLIIETHSEYLIKKLQILVAKNQISFDAISINYFQLNKENSIVLDQIGLTAKGSLSKTIPGGFSDVTNNITNELFKLNHQHN